ncbi:MAG: DUF3419 family protein [Chitinophagaceae bacterium]|nr:MAG: DUF3419 family protein [Chitinophagaceae bacterium]
MIYYSHVNEDNRVEKGLLDSSICTTVVAVAGSGERVLALMENDLCNEFHIIDVNQESLFLLQLKLEALKTLSIDEYYQFTGHNKTSGKKRKELFEKIKDKLAPSCKMYWQQTISAIESGILYNGHFEKFLSRVRPSVNMFLGNNFQLLFSGTSAQSRNFPSLRWKFLRKIYSFRWIYKMWGNKDIAFTGKDVDTAHIPNALNEVIYKNESASCFMMHLVFKGHLNSMKEKDLPPSLQQSILKRIKRRLETNSISITYHHTDLLSFAKDNDGTITHPAFYSISDVLSFEKYNYIDQLLDTVNSKDDMLVWRSFLSNRTDSKQQEALADKYTQFFDLTDNETSRMYQVFAVKK